MKVFLRRCGGTLRDDKDHMPRHHTELFRPCNPRAPEDLDMFELHDAFSIIAALSLEACGFAEPGQGVSMAQQGGIEPGGTIPISTMGGLKARGHPVGATGLYQLVEAVLQLRGEAGDAQLDGVRTAMTQNIGGSGATVVTHILEAS